MKKTAVLLMIVSMILGMISILKIGCNITFKEQAKANVNRLDDSGGVYTVEFMLKNDEKTLISQTVTKEVYEYYEELGNENVRNYNVYKTSADTLYLTQLSGSEALKEYQQSNTPEYLNILGLMSILLFVVGFVILWLMSRMNVRSGSNKIKINRKYIKSNVLNYPTDIMAVLLMIGLPLLFFWQIRVTAWLDKSMSKNAVYIKFFLCFICLIILYGVIIEIANIIKKIKLSKSKMYVQKKTLSATQIYGIFKREYAIFEGEKLSDKSKHKFYGENQDKIYREPGKEFWNITDENGNDIANYPAEKYSIEENDFILKQK